MDLSVAFPIGTLVNFLIWVGTAFRNIAQTDFWVFLLIGSLLLLDSILGFLFAIRTAEPQQAISVR